MNFLSLDRQAMARALSMGEAIEALRQALAPAMADGVQVPPRTIMTLGDSAESNQVLVMPAALPLAQAVAVKVSTITPDNPRHGRPLIHALVILLSSQTGEILALMEGAHLTALRTGAMAGLATDLLARPASRVLAVIGAGVQARSQIEAVCAVRPIEQLLLHSRSLDKARALAAWVSDRGLCPQVMVTDSVARAVRMADVICTATSTASAEPLVRAADVRPGTHINAIGGVDEMACEIDPLLLGQVAVYVEERDAALREAGELIQSLRLGVLMPGDVQEIASLLGGSVVPRGNASSLFKSVGTAIQDVAVAAALLRSARTKGLGTRVSL
ncbi:ornithine cyclodeaminase family protein [Pseudomonas sp. BLCC-B112]|uniref:ornithine cyclodeaminase family protein n=1 Tax=Pseudomonas sp. BLCC-B112 TaxID=3025319 RepID=UPI00234DF83C|nr:ornithine cyclodeaminase family protein [Pseudomonas sp. BLCC-B112]MDC7813812.1 ornithine cyclodeaminase family protein [Pseudomonas sp. BLCC-B112]